MRDLDRNGLNSMPVSMQQVSLPYMHLADLDRASEVNNVGEGVRNRQVLGKQLELERSGHFHIANRAVRHRANESEGTQDTGVDVADERAEAWMRVQVFHD